jgi:hypothetical protein
MFFFFAPFLHASKTVPLDAELYNLLDATGIFLSVIDLVYSQLLLHLQYHSIHSETQ